MAHHPAAHDRVQWSAADLARLPTTRGGTGDAISHLMYRRSMGGIAFVLALATPAAADRIHAHHDLGGVPASLAPERWHTGAGVGLDRSGDLRPEAIAILDAIEGAD